MIRDLKADFGDAGSDVVGAEFVGTSVSAPVNRTRPPSTPSGTR